MIKKIQSKFRSSSFLLPVKEDLGLWTAEVYSIVCECGQVYIGQTGRSLETRIKEHYLHIRLGNPDKLTVAKHRFCLLLFCFFVLKCNIRRRVQILKFKFIKFSLVFLVFIFLLTIQLWDVILCCWVSDSRCFECTALHRNVGNPATRFHIPEETDS